MNASVIFLAVLLISCMLTSCALTYGLWRFPLRNFWDKAGDRSLHAGVVPRSGGIAMVVAFVAAYVAIGLPFFSPVLMMALLLLCGVSLWDDITPIAAMWRLVVQVVACALMVFAGNLYVLLWDGVPVLISQLVTLLGMIWMINLYNFMDGMDGFASGMGMFGFATLSLLGYLQGDLDYSVINAVLVAAIAGFWVWNFPPARIFMGDTGAISLGALAGVMALLGAQRELFPLWVPAIIFSPFWVDATYTLFRRILRRDKYWQAHRTHLYQRLVIAGLGHRGVVLWQYLLMAGCCLSVSLPPMMGLDYNAMMLLLWGALYLALILRVEISLKK